MKYDSRVLIGFILGVLLGLTLSTCRDQLAHFPVVVVSDAVGLWAYYLSNSLLLAGVITTLYFAVIFSVAAWFLVSHRNKLALGSILALCLVHVLLIWRLDSLLGGSIGQIPQLLFSK